MSENKRTYALSIRDALHGAVQQAEDNPANIHIPTPGQRGAVIGIINKLAGGDDNRKLLLGWLFAHEGEVFDRLSTKTLNDFQWAALYAWCDFRKDEERIVWMPKDTFNQECLACLSAAMDDYFEINYLEREDLPAPPDIVATAIEIGQGEITDTGAGKSAIKIPDDSAFTHEKELPEIITPENPYVAASPGERLDTQKIIDELGFDSEPIEIKRPALKPIFKEKPKLINPFD